MSYPPPSDKWTLTATSCSPIVYSGSFSWDDLTQCTDFDGKQLMTPTDDGSSITLSGTLYVNVASPFSMTSTDTGFYRSHPLIQQDFSIKINKQINVLSSTDIDLFIASIISVSEDESDGSFELSVLTQSADFIELTSEIIIGLPDDFNVGTAQVTQDAIDCLVTSSFTCAQIFTIKIPASDIQQCDDTNPADFSGEYNLGFQVSGSGDTFDAFVEENGGSTNIALSVNSTFIDSNCDPELYQVTFTGSIEFFDDDQFSIIHDSNNGDYVIGQDTIYIEVTTDLPDNQNENYNIFGVIIDNVFVCTTDTEPSLNQTTGQGGCLSNDVDVNGTHTLISGGVITAQGTLVETNIISSQDGTSSSAQFSFLTFDTARTTIFIQVQLTVLLQNGSRRRLQIASGGILNDNDDAQQIRHFVDSTGIGLSSDTTPAPIKSQEIISSANNLSIIISNIVALLFAAQ